MLEGESLLLLVVRKSHEKPRKPDGEKFRAIRRVHRRH
jgi:hypothetical protein